MTDIVERLRTLLKPFNPDAETAVQYIARLEAAVDQLREAADEIERLRNGAGYELLAQTCAKLSDRVDARDAEIEQLRGVIEQVADDFGDGLCVCEQTKEECTNALRGKFHD